MRNQRAFTRADALVLCLLFVILVSLVPRLIAAESNLAKRANCAANLRGILSSCVIYAAQNNDQFPYLTGQSAVRYDTILQPAAGKDTSDKTVDALYADNLYPNNVYAPMWLLVVDQGLSPKLFICKEDPFEPKRADTLTGTAYYLNFQDPRNISYSIAYMWQEDKKGEIVPAAWWRNTTDASIPLMADMAPYLSVKAPADEFAAQPLSPPDENQANQPAEKGNPATFRSQNHASTGQNVAFADVHVDWSTRADIGQANDNIWTQTIDKKEKTIEAGKLQAKLDADNTPYDIVMVPTRTAKGDLK